MDDNPNKNPLGRGFPLSADRKRIWSPSRNLPDEQLLRDPLLSSGPTTLRAR